MSKVVATKCLAALASRPRSALLSRTSSSSIRHFSNSPLRLASPAADAVASSENPRLPSLHTFTEEEEMLRDTARKFSEDVVNPLVREMDEAEKMDPSIIKGLFENGVGLKCPVVQRFPY